LSTSVTSVEQLHLTQGATQSSGAYFWT